MGASGQEDNRGAPAPSPGSGTPAGELTDPRIPTPSGVSTLNANTEGPELDELSKNVAAIDIRANTAGSDTDTDTATETETDIEQDDETVQRRQEVVDRIMRSFRAALESKVEEAKAPAQTEPEPVLEMKVAGMTIKDEAEAEEKEDDDVDDDGDEVVIHQGVSKAMVGRKTIFSRLIDRARRSSPTQSSSQSSPSPPVAASIPAPVPPPVPAREATKKGTARESAGKEKEAADRKSEFKSAAPASFLRMQSSASRAYTPPAARRRAAAAPGASNFMLDTNISDMEHILSRPLPLSQQPGPEIAPAPLSSLSTASLPRAAPPPPPASRQAAPPPPPSRQREIRPAPQEAPTQEPTPPPPPPPLSSFRQSVQPVLLRRRHFVPEPEEAPVVDDGPLRALGTYGGGGPSQVTIPHSQPVFETLDFYRELPQAPSNAVYGPLGASAPPAAVPTRAPMQASADEASLEHLRHLLPPGAFSGLDAPGFTNLQGAFSGAPHPHSNVFMGLGMLGSPFPDLSGPSVISPISLSDASESLGVSPEAQRKHEQGEDGVASDHDGRRKKAKRTAGKGVEGPAGKKFACPYFKRNRVKYSKWTSCPGPGWDEVHRVKTHLYRRHALPIQCPRCWGVFKSDELLRSHLQQNPPCVSSDNRTLVEGFTKDQEKRLRSRKKAQADTTDDDKWREIYTILFPDDDEQSIPSPYYEPADYDEPSPPRRTSGSGPSSDLEDYTTFVKREMPTLVRREIEVMLQHDNFEDPQLEARFRSRIADVVLQLQPRLIDLYKQSQTPLSEWGPASGTVNPGSDSSMFTPALSQHTGTDAGSTPATVDGQQPSVPVASDGLGLYDGGGFTFDPNVGSGAGAWDGQAGGDPVVDVSAFDWDEEFESMLNPSLFMPQGLQYQYVPQPEPVLPSGVPRAWGNTK